MKRLLILIFSFYLLAITVKPCSDKDDCSYPNTEQTPLTKADHSSHEDDSENCSPFCMCACCGQLLTSTHHQPNLELNFPTASPKIAFDKTYFIPEVLFSIWQPPKIS